MRKQLLAVVAVSVVFASAAKAASPYDDSRVHPLSLDPTTEERLIEPTSPILGSRLAKLIRDDERDPDVILADIKNYDPNLQRDIALSVLDYLEVLAPGTNQACQASMANSVAPKGGWKLAEDDTIPYDILVPLHSDYTQRAHSLEWGYAAKPLEVIQDQAKTMSENVRSLRLNCKGPEKLEHLENILAGICQAPFAMLEGNFVNCETFVSINNEIMSPELAYPRAEFSINGFTRYVYGEIFKMNDLKPLLHSMLAAEKDWLALPRPNGVPAVDFTTYTQKRVLADGFSPRELLLAFSYSTRNMPSLDVEYGIDPEKALLLEVYFWQFHRIREDVKGKELRYAYPNHVFEEDPGVYHYMTAALQACELKLAGYNSELATASSTAQSFGYKTDKLISATDIKKSIHHPMDIINLAKEQGFVPGVDSGIYGGEYGSKICSH